MTAPHYINENKSDMRGIKSGWYAIENDGTLSSGPFSSREQCNEKITQPTNGKMATSRVVNLLGHLDAGAGRRIPPPIEQPPKALATSATPSPPATCPEHWPRTRLRPSPTTEPGA